MSASMDFIVKTNNEKEANLVVSIIKDMAAKRIPEYPSEIDQFVAGIKVNYNVVEVKYSYSLTSNTFCEWIPQIMLRISRCDIGAITMDAGFFSESCGYEARFSGRIFKNHKFRMDFTEHE